MTKRRSRRSPGGSGLQAALPILLLLSLGMAACERSTAREAGRQSTRRKTCRPGVRDPRPTRGTRDQIFRLAQDLLQDAWNKHGVPDIDRGHFRDGSVRGPHRPDRTRGRQGGAAANVPSRRPLPPGRGQGSRSIRAPPAGFPTCGVSPTPALQPTWPIPNCSRKWRRARSFVLEVVDSSVLTVSTSLPLNQFATVRQGTPAQTFEQAIDE